LLSKNGTNLTRAPELHTIDDKWYIIFTGDPNHGLFFRSQQPYPH
jgi:GH43 family beta-xylosidase